MNYNEHPTGISCVEIGNWEEILVVRTFGAVSPAPIDWGEVGGLVFTSGVDEHRAAAFCATYDLTFARVRLMGWLAKQRLVVSAYSIFTDGSGRASYFQQDQFYRR